MKTITTAMTPQQVLEMGLQLAGGWREAIVEMEDFCSEPVRLKNMMAAADQIDAFVQRAKEALTQSAPITAAELHRRMPEE